MHDWPSMIYSADEWLVAYASLPGAIIGPVIFSVGHALELYLKSVYTKQTNDIDKAIKFGHRIKDLWDECKKNDNHFLPQYKIRESIYNIDFLDQQCLNTLSRDDRLQFIKFQLLYIHFKHLPDLKYMGLPWKTRNGPYSIAFVHRDPFWIDFFKNIRLYLGYPPNGKVDHIRQLIDLQSLDSPIISYLVLLFRFMFSAPLVTEVIGYDVSSGRIAPAHYA